MPTAETLSGRMETVTAREQMEKAASRGPTARTAQTARTERTPHRRSTTRLTRKSWISTRKAAGSMRETAMPL